MDSRLKVSERILERGKKKAMVRKDKGRSQRRILLNHKGTEKLVFLCVSVSPWLKV